MAGERVFKEGIRCFPSVILMEEEVIDKESWQRRTIRQIRRYQAEGGSILAVVLEIDLLATSTHSKTLVETIEGLPRTLTSLTWVTINGQRESMVLHSYLTPTDQRELIERYRYNKEISPVERVMLDGTTDAQTIRQILKRRTDTNTRE